MELAQEANVVLRIQAQVVDLVSQLRDTFDADSAEEWASRPVTLCTGEGAPMLVCLKVGSDLVAMTHYSQQQEV